MENQPIVNEEREDENISPELEMFENFNPESNKEKFLSKLSDYIHMKERFQEEDLDDEQIKEFHEILKEKVSTFEALSNELITELKELDSSINSIGLSDLKSHYEKLLNSYTELVIFEL